jgi:3-oxoacyl-[acyl-carrier protein] reductase
MQLQGKNVVIYGAGSEIGAAVAHTFAREGASLFLAGRSKEQLDAVVREVRTLGGRAEAASVDPLDADSVERHLTYVVNQHGSLDLSINLAFLAVPMGARLTGVTDQEFVAAAFTRARSNFVTSTAAARKMAYQGSGVVLAATLAQSGPHRGEVGGLAIGSAAIEVFFRQLASEVGPYGVRVSCLRYGAFPEGAMVDQVFKLLAPGGRAGAAQRPSGEAGLPERSSPCPPTPPIAAAIA